MFRPVAEKNRETSGDCNRDVKLPIAVEVSSHRLISLLPGNKTNFVSKGKCSVAVPQHNVEAAFSLRNKKTVV